MAWRGILTESDEIALDVRAEGGNYNVDPADDVVIATGVTTITLPDASTVAGKLFRVKRNDASNTVTVDTAGGNIDGAASVDLTTQYESLAVVSDGTNYWRFPG